MKVVFFLVIAFVNCDEMEVTAFRYKEGYLSIGDEPAMKVMGSAYTNVNKKLSDLLLQYHGMDHSTMTPFYVTATGRVDAGDVCECECWMVKLGRRSYIKATGIVSIRKSVDKLTITGKCITEENVVWEFNSVSTKSKSVYFQAKEAGLRAKTLLGCSAEKFLAAHVVSYATVDRPYFTDHCGLYLVEDFPVAPGPEPGVIIVSKDGKHCAIADNEGTKFIQTNPWEKKVTEHSIALLSYYFPNGIIFKRYPKELTRSSIETMNYKTIDANL